ncbi:hypothetical protein WDU94_010333 [Cyamophila willieti]
MTQMLPQFMQQMQNPEIQSMMANPDALSAIQQIQAGIEQLRTSAPGFVNQLGINQSLPNLFPLQRHPPVRMAPHRPQLPASPQLPRTLQWVRIPLPTYFPNSCAPCSKDWPISSPAPTLPPPLRSGIGLNWSS